MLLLVCCNISLQAQENLQFKKLTTLEGLSSNSISDVRQDKYGYLWIITGELLNRYDGKTFKEYKNDPDDSTSLAKNRLWELFLDKNLNLWVNGNDFISKYNYADDSFTNYPIRNVFQIVQDSYGEFWLTKIEGTFHFNPETGEINPIKLAIDSSIVTSTRFGAINELSDGTLLAHQSRIGLFEFNRDSKIFSKVDWGNSDILEKEEFVFYIIDDTLGNVWLNGFKLIKYNKQEDSVSIYNYGADERKFISKIGEDENKNLWFQERLNGKYVFYKLNPYNDDYKIIDSDNGLDDFNYSSFYMDRNGIYWIGGSRNGLFKADPSIEPIESYRSGVTGNYIIESDSIRCIYNSPFDPDVIWVGTYKYGLYKYTESKNRFEKISLKFNKPDEEDISNAINGIYEDSKYLWFGIDYVGLCRLDKSNKKYKIYYHDEYGIDSILPFFINRIISDDKGNLWIGGNGGISYFNVREEKFTNFYPHQSKSYSSNLLNEFSNYEKNNEMLYGITDAGDSTFYSEEFTVKSTARFLVQSTGELWLWINNAFNDYGWIENSSGDTVWTLKDYLSTMRVGYKTAFQMKLDAITLEPGKYTLNYISDSKNSSGLLSEVEEYKRRYGIQLYDLSFDNFQRFQKLLNEELDRDLLSGFVVYDLHLDNKNLWATTSNGINKLNLQTQEISYFKNGPILDYSDEYFSKILVQSDSTLWIGSDDGLCLFNKNDGSVKYYNLKDGLPSNTIFSMVRDDLGNIWLSTENGISKFINSNNPFPPRFINYDTRDGLNSNTFNRNSAVKSGSGKLYFGSSYGINSFLPSYVNSTEPIVGITNLYIKNNEITVNSPNTPLTKNIYETDKIVLEYEQNSFGFSFNSFHFSRPSKNKLAHMLEGFDKDWIYDNKSNVTYTNMEPGEYTFKVKGSNGDGFWNEEGKSVKITILKPWYTTYWAYFGYILVFGLIVFGIDRVQRKRVLAKAREEMKIKDAEHRAETAELQAKAAEAQSRAIKIENERKTKELEEARQLQLSMLPKEIPQLSNLDIAVYMKTATEVGGDYYDFHVHLDGTLTVVLGDATGHGMKAGTMVTSTKSLFNSYAEESNITRIFNEMTKCIKKMRFENLFMSFTMLKIKDSHLSMSAGGMPPVYIYRSEKDSAEEHLFKGMPLGTINNFPYDIKELKLNKGDVILLTSDGLPELQNGNNEQYGYKRLRNKFEEYAKYEPLKIIDHFNTDANLWLDGHEADDDVTFVVIKVI